MTEEVVAEVQGPVKTTLILAAVIIPWVVGVVTIVRWVF